MKKAAKRRRVKAAQCTSVAASRASSRRWPWVLAIAVVVCVVSGLILVAGPDEEPHSPHLFRLLDDHYFGKTPQTASSQSAESSILEALGSAAKNSEQIEAEECALAELVRNEYPGSFEAYMILGTVHRLQGDSTKATEYWEKALAIRPKAHELYLKMGEILSEKGEVDEAIKIWKRGVSIVPSAPSLRWEIAYALATKNRHEEALPFVLAECELTSGSPRNHYLLGQTYGHLKMYDKARTQYEKTIEIQPDHYNAYYGLGKLSILLNQKDEAKAFMAKFKSLKEAFLLAEPEPDNFDIIKARAARIYGMAQKVFADRGRERMAEKMVQRAIVLDPSNTGYVEKMAVLAFKSGRLNEAKQWYQKARQIDPDNSLFLLNIGKLEYRLRQPARAEKTFQTAIRLFPKESLLYAELARLYLTSQTKPAMALALAKQAVSLDAAAVNYFLLGWAYDANQDYPNAMTAMEAAMKLKPDNMKYRGIYENIKRKAAL